MMTKKVGTLCIVFGVCLILSAVTLLCANQWEAWQARLASEHALAQLVPTDAPRETSQDSSSTNLPTIEIDDNAYIGYVHIPRLNLSLPVMNEWNYERLKISPCRYYGSPITGNFVIAAHNYTTHFGRLAQLDVDDEITFTTVGKTTYRYKIATKDVLLPAAVEEMTTAKYDLTLFTCTFGGESRVTIRCNKYS